MAEKESHSVVQYGPGHKSGDHCAICKYVLPGPHCKKVVDPIASMGWCRRFEKAPVARG